MQHGRGVNRVRGVLATMAGPALVAALLLVGCTGSTEQEVTPTPVPTPVEEPPPAPSGRDIEVVLPPAQALDDGVAEGLRRRVAALAAGLPDDVGSLTVRRPDTDAFVVDLAELAAARGTGLVCLLGPDTGGTTDTLALRYRGATFCGLPTLLPEPDEEGELTDTPAVRVELPVAGLGELVGVAAAEVAQAAADEPVVGLVLGGDELPSAVFREGLLRGLTGVEVVEVVEVEEEDATPIDVVDALLAAGAEVIVLDGHRGAREVVEVLEGRVAVVGPVDVVDAAPAAEVAFAYRLRHEVALAAVFDSFSSGTLDEIDVLLGVDDGVLDLRVGPGRSALEDAVERARVALAARDDPRAPVPEGPEAVPGVGP